MKDKVVAIVLAAGQGKRMGGTVPKQYLTIEEKPILYYTLKTFQESKVDEIILVAGKEQLDSCRKDIVEKYGFNKVKSIVSGGKERYESVYYGLQSVRDAAYILIHDGARPCITASMIEHTIHEVITHKACVLGVPSKDTIKVIDENNKVIDTPDRNSLWMVQTPQAFEAGIVKQAYKQLMQAGITNVTDDAMVVEKMSDMKITMIKGEYTNIKVTTPEDLPLAALFLSFR